MFQLNNKANMDLPLSASPTDNSLEWTFSFLLKHSGTSKFQVLMPKRFMLRAYTSEGKYKVNILQEGATVHTLESSGEYPETWLEFKFGASNSLQKGFLEIKNASSGSDVFVLSEEDISISMSRNEPTYVELREKSSGTVKGLREMRYFREYLPTIYISSPMSAHTVHKLVNYYRLNEHHGNTIYNSGELGDKYTLNQLDYEWATESSGDIASTQCQYPYQILNAEGLCLYIPLQIAIFQPPLGNGGKYLLWDDAQYKCYMDTGEYKTFADPPCPSHDHKLDAKHNIQLLLLGDLYKTDDISNFTLLPTLPIHNYSTNTISFQAQMEPLIYQLHIDLYLLSGGQRYHSSRSIFIDLLPDTDVIPAQEVYIYIYIYIAV